MQQEKDSIIVSNVDTVDAVREWRLKTFGKTLLYCLIPLTVPLIACFLICKVGQMAIVTTGLLLTFILSLFLARRKRLAFSVNLAIINLYYLLNLNITDGYYFTVFMIIIAGVFLGIRAAFIWAVIQASLLITIAYFSPEYTVFQDLPIYFGKQPVSGNQKLYFSTFIMDARHHTITSYERYVS